jgi:hypothetical protein
MDPRATRATRVSAIHSSYAIISNVQLDLENAALSKQDTKTMNTTTHSHSQQSQKLDRNSANLYLKFSLSPAPQFSEVEMASLC